MAGGTSLACTAGDAIAPELRLMQKGAIRTPPDIRTEKLVAPMNSRPLFRRRARKRSIAKIASDPNFYDPEDEKIPVYPAHVLPGVDV